MDLLKPDASWFEIDPQYYRHGGSCLNQAESEGVDVRPGQSILIAPPGSGEEALSFANLGADVTVLGDAEMLARVERLADGAGMQVKLTTGDADDPGAAFGEEVFDAVYCPWGTLDWLEAFDTWAQSVANVLKPAGRLVLYDRHPISTIGAAHKGLFVVGKSYFGDHDPKSHGWTLGDLISSLGAEGLATMLFDEFPDADRFPTPLDGLGIRWDIRWRLPAAMLLVAVRVR